jgi:hypothetical protein
LYDDEGQKMADDDKVMLHNLEMFQFGDLPDDGIALLLAYATSQEKLTKGEMETFVIGMTRLKAAELGIALLQKSGMASVVQESRPTEH